LERTTTAAVFAAGTIDRWSCDGIFTEKRGAKKWENDLKSASKIELQIVLEEKLR
jgi:hypothetical protein